MTQPKRTLLRVLFWCVIAIASGCFALAHAENHIDVPADPWTMATVDNPMGSFRYTANGWEDTIHWRLEKDEARVTFIDQIHPAVWMLAVVLAASGLAVMASDEESVRRIWSDRRS